LSGKQGFRSAQKRPKGVLALKTGKPKAVNLKKVSASFVDTFFKFTKRYGILGIKNCGPLNLQKRAQEKTVFWKK